MMENDIFFGEPENETIDAQQLLPEMWIHFHNCFDNIEQEPLSNIIRTSY